MVNPRLESCTHSPTQVCSAQPARSAVLGPLFATIARPHGRRRARPFKESPRSSTPLDFDHTMTSLLSLSLSPSLPPSLALSLSLFLSLSLSPSLFISLSLSLPLSLSLCVSFAPPSCLCFCCACLFFSLARRSLSFYVQGRVDLQHVDSLSPFRTQELQADFRNSVCHRTTEQRMFDIVHICMYVCMYVCRSVGRSGGSVGLASGCNCADD